MWPAIFEIPAIGQICTVLQRQLRDCQYI